VQSATGSIDMLLANAVLAGGRPRGSALGYARWPALILKQQAAAGPREQITMTESTFHWEPQPSAAAWVGRRLDDLVDGSDAVVALRETLLLRTGTRLFDWVDSLGLSGETLEERELVELGFAGVDPSVGAASSWEHPGALLPRIDVLDRAARIAINVDSVCDVLSTAPAWLPSSMKPRLDGLIEGGPWSSTRQACIVKQPDLELWASERRGPRGREPTLVLGNFALAAARGFEAMCTRPRHGSTDAGFAVAERIVRRAQHDLGDEYACALFFAAERDYWQRRNHAGRVQRARQDVLGLGWGNHDHHTFRSSRECFKSLIGVLELLGLQCRERFFAGREAGWGAQVLEHPTLGIQVFADVDLSPDEVEGDFAHDGLEPARELGTVGLWCKLHGEAFLQAGMHHLEAQFDFETVIAQLAELGVSSMAPFTSFSYLKQAFTEGEVWSIERRCLDDLLAARQISRAEADEFGSQGARGSHLEILERNDGYKGFNQTGISDIIRKTDPRH